MREVRLVGAEAAHRAAGRVVRVDGDRLDVDVRHAVGAARVAGRALEHLPADRRVRARVAEHARLHGGQPALGVAADRVLHRESGGAWGAGGSTPRGDSVSFTGRRVTQREQRRLRLHRHVLLAAERAAVGHQLDEDAVLGEAEERRHLPAVVEDPLSLREEVQRAVGARLGQRALGLEVQVLDALRLPRAVHDVSARGERRVGVAAPDDRARQEVRVLRVDLRGAGRERLVRGRRTGARTSYSTSTRAAAARAVCRSTAATAANTSPTQRTSSPSATNPGQSCSIRPYQRLPGTSRGGDDRHHAGERRRARRVDADDARAGVRRQRQRAVQQVRPGRGRPRRAGRRAPTGRRRTAPGASPTPPSARGSGIASPRRPRAISSIASTIFL